MTKKICYVFTSAGLNSDSIQKKVIAQINGLIESGVKCRGAFFTSEVNEITKFNEHVDFIPYPLTKRKYFNIIYQKSQLLKSVSLYIESTLETDEYIYLRYPGATFRLVRLARKFQGRIISEHQAKEIDEFRSARNEHLLGFSINKLISYFLYQFWPITNERLWSRTYSKLLLAKVAVTNEIARYHQQYCKQVWVIPNGIETINYKLRNVPEWDGVVKIMFLKGTSAMASWNGLDRLIRSIDVFQSTSIRIQLFICGTYIKGEVVERPYIVHKGYLKGEDLDALFSEVTLGFSTLCLFRKNLEEAAVLKAREYFARGLPFVYAYTDPDIDHLDPINTYLLHFPNNDSLIDFNEVIGFAKRVTHDKKHPQTMRNFAENKLDWKVKMEQLKQLI